MVEESQLARYMYGRLEQSRHKGCVTQVLKSSLYRIEIGNPAVMRPRELESSSFLLIIFQ